MARLSLALLPLTLAAIFLCLLALAPNSAAWTPPPLYQKEFCKGLFIPKDTPDVVVDRYSQADIILRTFLIWDRQKIVDNTTDQLTLTAAHGKVEERLRALFTVNWVPTDLRFPRKRSGASCEPKICGNLFTVSQTLLQECRDASNRTIPETPLLPPDGTTNSLKNIGQIGHAALSIWLEVDPGWCNGGQPAYMVPEQAGAHICGFDKTTRRPTHGAIVLCVEPRHYDVDELYVVLLHNILHIMLGPVSGSYFAKNPKRGQSQAATTFDKQEYLNDAQGHTYVNRQLDFQTRKMYWEVTNYTVQTAMTTTDSVLAHVRDYFDCPTLAGAEWSSRREGNNLFSWMKDEDHWSARMFPEEILSPLLIPYKNISSLTLALAEDSGWYGVHMDKQEGMTTRPILRGCEVSNKSEGQLLDMVRWAEFEEKIKPVDYGPYCDHWGPVTTSLCTADGRAILRCWAFDSTHFSDIRYPAKYNFDFTYDMELSTPYCTKMTNIPVVFQTAGFRTGPNTMCVTVTEAPNIPPSVNLQVFLMPMCIEYSCDENRDMITLVLQPNNQRCELVCRGGDTEKLRTFDNCAHKVSILCPSVDKVCRGKIWGTIKRIGKSKGEDQSGGSMATFCPTVMTVIEIIGFLMSRL